MTTIIAMKDDMTVRFRGPRADDVFRTLWQPHGWVQVNAPDPVPAQKPSKPSKDD